MCLLLFDSSVLIVVTNNNNKIRLAIASTPFSSVVHISYFNTVYDVAGACFCSLWGYVPGTFSTEVLRYQLKASAIGISKAHPLDELVYCSFSLHLHISFPLKWSSNLNNRATLLLYSHLYSSLFLIFQS